MQVNNKQGHGYKSFPSLQDLAAKEVFKSKINDFQNFLKSSMLSESQVECFNSGEPKAYLVDSILFGKYNSILWKYFSQKINKSFKEYNHDIIISSIKFSPDLQEIVFGDHAGILNSIKLNQDLNRSYFLSNNSRVAAGPINFINNQINSNGPFSTITSSGMCLKFWDTNFNCILTLPFNYSYKSYITSFDYNQTKNIIVLGFNTGEVVICNINGRRSTQFVHNGPISKVFFDDNNNYWVCCSDGRICCVNLDTNNKLDFFISQFLNITPQNCFYSIKNHKIYILVESNNKFVLTFDINNKIFAKAFEISRFNSSISLFDISPDGKNIAMGFLGGGLSIYNIINGENVWDSGLSFSQVISFAFSPDGKKFAFSTQCDIFIYSMPRDFIDDDLKDITSLLNLIDKLKNHKNKPSCMPVCHLI